MENKEYKRRLIDEKIDEYLNTFGALCIEGPKWCGKTWSSLYHCQSKVMLGDPSGNFQNRKLAQIEPSIILDGECPRLIDEWQEVPELWDADPSLAVSLLKATPDMLLNDSNTLGFLFESLCERDVNYSDLILRI